MHAMLCSGTSCAILLAVIEFPIYQPYLDVAPFGIPCILLAVRDQVGQDQDIPQVMVFARARLPNNCVWNVTEPMGNIRTLSLVSFQESPSLFTYGDGIKLSLSAS